MRLRQSLTMFALSGALSLLVSAGISNAAPPPGAPAMADAAVSAMAVQKRYVGPDGGWDFMTFDPVHRRVYLSRTSGVTALDVDTGKVTSELVAGSRTHIALPINGGDEILVTNAGTGGAFIADALTGKIRVASIPTGKKPDGALLEPLTGLVWVLDNSGGGIAVIDPKSGSKVATIAVEGALESATPDSSGKVYITVEDKTEIVVVDATKRAVIQHIKLDGCDEPGGLALAPQSKRLVVACANGVSKTVDIAKGSIVASLPIGPRPDVALYDPGRGLVFIPTGGDGKMTAIDPATMKVVGVIATAMGARSGAIDPKTDRIYLPSARYGEPAKAGDRPAAVPRSFAFIAVGSP